MTLAPTEAHQGLLSPCRICFACVTLGVSTATQGCRLLPCAELSPGRVWHLPRLHGSPKRSGPALGEDLHLTPCQGQGRMQQGVQGGSQAQWLLWGPPWGASLERRKASAVAAGLEWEAPACQRVSSTCNAKQPPLAGAGWHLTGLFVSSC